MGSETLIAAQSSFRSSYSSPRLDVEARKLRRGRRVERQIVLPQLRAHADLVDPIGFERFMLDVAGKRDFDVMLEAKAKGPRTA